MKNKKNFPRHSKVLAYVIGVALGDGNLSNPNGRAVRLRVTCDVKYPKLIEKIKKSLESVLPNKVSIVKKPKNSIDVSCYSNMWEKILGWEAKKGSKFKQNVKIPLWVYTRKSYMVSCLKGLIETDGCIYSDRGYKMVMFTNIVAGLAENVNRIIHSLGYKSHLYKIEKQKSKYGFKKQTLYHVRLSRDVEKFLKIVKPDKI